MNIRRLVYRLEALLRHTASHERLSEHQRLLLGRLMVEKIRKKRRPVSLKEVEFSAFSQWGDDGIVQYLLQELDIAATRFIEFGVGDYRESTTRFLLMNDNWSGLVFDSSSRNIERIIHSEIYWRYQLTAAAAFITAENINSLIRAGGFEGEIGLLHIDLDGNDYWVWKAIDVVSPVIAVIEYNSVFGRERPITVPYDPSFQRSAKHFSHLYFGASLKALCHLALQKGYGFIGCNRAGNNAYFIRRDRLARHLKELSVEEGFVESRFRESRDPARNRTYVGGPARADLIRSFPVANVTTGQIEPF